MRFLLVIFLLICVGIHHATAQCVVLNCDCSGGVGPGMDCATCTGPKCSCNCPDALSETIQIKNVSVSGFLPMSCSISGCACKSTGDCSTCSGSNCQCNCISGVKLLLGSMETCATIGSCGNQDYYCPTTSGNRIGCNGNTLMFCTCGDGSPCTTSC